MHYIWQHRLLSLTHCSTVDHRPVRIIDPGLPNTNAGPDFFNAKIEIDGHLWVGNVEIHTRASDWKRHHHHLDKAYDSVILHVVEKDDAPVYRTNGELIPQMVLNYSPHFISQYHSLVRSHSSLPCASTLQHTPSITIAQWIQSLAFERLQAKASRITHLHQSFAGSWEDTCYVTLARNLGFGINNDAFERLALHTPLRILHKHCDSILQVEALLFGQAGMLDSTQHPHDTYYQQLCSEYTFLANKFSLTPLDSQVWKSFRTRPQNFPHRRIATLAQFIVDGFRLMENILQAPHEDALRQLFSIHLTGYWATHYSFADTATNTTHKALGDSSIHIILINTVAPLYYAYATHTGNPHIADRAISLLESLRPEKNSIVTLFTSAGVQCPDALTSQALIQAKRQYCDPRKCIYCTIGHRLLSHAATSHK